MASTRLIVCAAIRNDKTDIVLCGVHHGVCMGLAIQLGLQDLRDSTSDWTVGFVDNEQQFLTRTEAWRVADAAGQIRRPTGWEKDYSQARPAGVGDEKLLFSENLYTW